MLQWLKQRLPPKDDIYNEKSLRGIRQFFHHSEYWHFHHRFVAKGVAIGLFINFLPIPFQMLFAAMLALVFRANLPIAIALTWINNPFTFIPINYFIYKVSIWFTGNNSNVGHPPMWNWHMDSFQEFLGQFMIWLSLFGKAYVVGLVVVSIGSAALGYSLILAIWKISQFISQRRNK